LENLYSSFSALIAHYGTWGIFILMVFENLGLPMPTEIGFLVGQSMVSTSSLNYLELFFIILSGKTLGSVVTYLAGKHFADNVRFMNRHQGLKRAQDKFAQWMKRYGNFTVFISRLIGYVRPWSSYLAGIGEIKILPFLFYNITGSAVIILVNMLFYGSLFSLWGTYEFLRPLVFVIIIFSSIGFWVWVSLFSKIRKKKHQI